MAKVKGVLYFLWFALKIILKKHFVNEWLFPLSIGFVVSVVTYYKFGQNIIINFFIIIIVSTGIFIGFSIARLNNESKATYDTKDEKDFFDHINNSSKFFCTSIFPDVLNEFKLWFESEMIEKHSVLTSKKMSQEYFMACRLLVFRGKDNLEKIKYSPYHDGTYARRVARIHKNNKIDIAYMTYEEFMTICMNYWDAFFKDDILKFDFAAFISPEESNIIYADDIIKESFLNPVRRIEYKNASNSETQRYSKLIQHIENIIYTETNELEEDYDFCKYLDVNN